VSAHVIVSPATSETSDHQRHLEKRAIKGTSYVVISYALTSGLRLLSTVVLSRLLAPSFFGLMALMTTIIVGLNLISHFGVNDSVVQNARGEEPLFLNTAWTMQFYRGILLWLLSFLVAWPAAGFYHERALLVILPVFGFSCVISAFSSPNLLLLTRQMAVGRISGLELLTQLVQFIVAAIWAYFYPSIWALLGGRLIAEVVRTIVSYRIKPYMPMVFAWDRSAVTSLLQMGRWILPATALTFFAMQSDRLILGRLVPWRMLGIYGIAYALSDIPRQIIGAFTTRVGYPFIARFSHLPRPEFRAVLLKYRGYVLAVGALLLTLMIVTGDQFILHVYDQRYHQAAWMVVILGCGLWHTLMADTLTPVLLSVQRAYYQTICMGLYCLVLFTSLPLGFHWFGMTGAVVAVAISDLPVYLVSAFGMRREKLSVIWQDIRSTVLFLTLLALELLARHALGFSNPFRAIP
jgi:O-antigen/teichoic acid export membrane protein